MRTKRFVEIAAACTVLIGLWIGGCATPPPVSSSGPDCAIAGFLQSSGLAKLQQARVRALAIVTIYEKGRSLSNRQYQVFDFKDKIITATAATGTGTWCAEVPAVGEARITGKTTFEDSKSIERTLRLLLHRARGPLNLMDGVEHPACAQDVCLLDEPLVRIAVTGDNRFAVAYYFDRATGLLKYVTSSADRPGGEGTITIYTWQKLPGGGVFPKTIKIMQIGQYALIGEQPVLEASYSDVSVCGG